MRRWPLALSALLLTACSNGPSPLPSLTTGSLFGGGSEKAAAPAGPVAPSNTPINRGFRVGTVSARAVKCGYNFDPAKVKASWLASESQSGTPADQMGSVEKAYSVGYNGVMKAIASKEGYCDGEKGREIKGDLAMLLAGNYTPQPLKPKAEEDDGSIVSFGSGVQVNNPFE